MEDKRLVNRITVYWEGLRKKSPMPSYSLLKGKEIADIWSYCCAWKVEVGEDTNFKYIYLHVGEDLKRDLQMSLHDQLNIEQFRHFPGARIIQKMDRMVEMKIAMKDEVNFITEENKIIKCRTCMLPFGTKDKVTHIVMAVSSGAFD